MVSVTLRAGPLQLVLVPAIGGSIASFDHVGGTDRQPLLRPAAPGEASVLGLASFPLVPYANRIRGGTFDCDGATIRLSPNLAGDRSPLHGQGWLNPWRVEAAGDTSARLHYLHEPDEWPWRYEAWQDFALDADGLSVTLGCRNLSAQRMPCGLAHHPYFPCDADTILDLDVETAWTGDADVLPVEEVPAAGRYGLRQRRICGTGLDNAFERWGGTATFDWPGQPKRLTMTSPDATRFHIYSPEGAPYFAAEPVQNGITGLNKPQADWPALGIELLEQGMARTMHMRLAVTDA